jgi:hypothetical protein
MPPGRALVPRLQPCWAHLRSHRDLSRRRARPLPRRRLLEPERHLGWVPPARLLKDAGLYNDALSRLYPALHHVTIALLLTEGIEPRRRRAISSLLSAHFLPSGTLTAEDIAIVSRTQSYRDLADYERA